MRGCLLSYFQQKFRLESGTLTPNYICVLQTASNKTGQSPMLQTLIVFELVIVYNLNTTEDCYTLLADFT